MGDEWLDMTVTHPTTSEQVKILEDRTYRFATEADRLRTALEKASRCACSATGDNCAACIAAAALGQPTQCKPPEGRWR